MLTDIYISNMALIEQLHIEFHAGMTVITGETGAGKSIIIDAIEFALGGRSQPYHLRTGSERAQVSLHFDIRHAPFIHSWLMAHECNDADTTTCLIQRTLSKDGRTRVSINHIPCTVSTLKELSLMLVNIQGQHEYQQLLKPQYPLQLIDQYGDLLSEIAMMRQLYDELKQCEKSLAEFNMQNTQTQIDFISFQLNELSLLNLQDGEIPQLEQEYKQLSHATELAEITQNALNLIADENESNALHLLNDALRLLEHAQQMDAEFNNTVHLLKTSLIELNEIEHELRTHSKHLLMNPERLNSIDERLSTLQTLARKHQVKPDELISLQKKLSQQLDALLHQDETRLQLQKARENAYKKYHTHAAALTQKRQAIARLLEKNISVKMHELNMKKGAVRFQFKTHEEPTAQGIDSISLEVCTNPGQGFQALAKTASGGELSRISLAIQVIHSEKQTLPVLIFDEVDVGISGKTATIVGSLLHELSHHSQVVCITHLAQVAAFGEYHLKVHKMSTDENTQTSVVALNHNERIEELARITSGNTLTEHALAHAKELLEQTH